jgi:hypothetical protein
MCGPEHGHSEVWASGAAYEPYVGRWSRLVGREFVRWLAVPASGRWLELGCGTGSALLPSGRSPSANREALPAPPS